MAKNEKRSIKISNGRFIGTNIAGGDITVGPPTDTGLDEIRRQLELYREEFVRAAGDQGDEAQRRLDRLDDELAEEEPDADAVRGGWKAVAKLLTGAGAAAESVKKIAELVHALFP